MVTAMFNSIETTSLLSDLINPLPVIDKQGLGDVCHEISVAIALS